MRLLRTSWRFARELAITSPGPATLSAVLMAALSFTEGAGLLLLMPLLELVGVTAANTMPRVSGWFDQLFAVLGLEATLGSVLLLFLVIGAARAALQIWQGRLTAAVREDFASSVRTRLYRAIAGAEWQYLVTRRSSEFVQLLATEVSRLGLAATYLIDLAAVVAVSVVYFGLAFHLEPTVATLIVLCAGAFALAMRGTLDRTRASGQRAADARRQLHHAIAEHLGSLKTAKSYGAVDRHADIFLRLDRGLRDVSFEVTARETGFQQTLEFGSAALLAFIVFISIDVLEVPAAPLLVMLFVFARQMPRLVSAYRLVQALAIELPVFDTVRELEGECRERAEPAAFDAGEVYVGTVGFDHVSFTYLEREALPALRDVTLDIEAGKTTAIVGPSGSGKSTLADVLIGLLQPTEGQMLVDHRPLDARRLRGWRRQTSYVPQDTFLFHDSIRANLVWARPDATDAMLWRALEQASATDFVTALPQGLDTVVGERGVLISGGERQRLSLARALLREPRVLVLDEATSALDSESEARIQQAIDALQHRMTIVAITHRLSTIRNADRIHVMDGGRLVETGTWDSLLAMPTSRFRELCLAQGLLAATPAPFPAAHPALDSTGRASVIH